jgi:hypothetical protein
MPNQASGMPATALDPMYFQPGDKFLITFARYGLDFLANSC